MVNSPFPKYVGFAVKTMDGLDDYLLSSEELKIISPRAVEKRKTEFILGRAACNSALRDVGLTPPPPVLKGRSGEPIWPEGYVGTITHTGDIAMCAVCHKTRADGIGMDIEKIEGDISPDVYNIVCIGRELEWVLENQSQSITRFKQIFSAKEAAFKAFSPHAPEFVDFKDAILRWDDEEDHFFGELLRPVGDAYPKGYGFEVGSLIVDGLVFSFILLPPKSLL
ncbi:MAG: 4'-phosphopantetheinyl transferase superfamily protein [Thermodesulfobacteriota bacterium]|nr:4'-phosphopantetheinyl transferase superfamily protein [Thermodesulfobacteriota bacterium]